MLKKGYIKSDSGANMKKRHYRAINFDLKVENLQKYYPQKNYLKGYDDIGNFLKAHGFYHKQYSGYRSEYKLSDKEVLLLMNLLRKEHPWISKCVTSFDVTNIGDVYELEFVLTSSEYVDNLTLDNFKTENKINLASMIADAKNRTAESSHENKKIVEHSR